MSRRTIIFGVAVLLVVAALASWSLRDRLGGISPRPNSDPALEHLRARDGEQNPLVVGDAIAGSADMWRSSRERAELERRASAGDANAALELWGYYAFTTDDRRSARHWLELAAREGNETAQFNLAVEIGASDCAEAKRRLESIAARTKDADTRTGAISWIHDPYLCAAKGPVD